MDDCAIHYCNAFYFHHLWDPSRKVSTSHACICVLCGNQHAITGSLFHANRLLYNKRRTSWPRLFGYREGHVQIDQTDQLYPWPIIFEGIKRAAREKEWFSEDTAHPPPRCPRHSYWNGGMCNTSRFRSWDAVPKVSNPDHNGRNVGRLRRCTNRRRDDGSASSLLRKALSLSLDRKKTESLANKRVCISLGPAGSKIQSQNVMLE